MVTLINVKEHKKIYLEVLALLEKHELNPADKKCVLLECADYITANAIRVFIRESP